MTEGESLYSILLSKGIFLEKTYLVFLFPVVLESLLQKTERNNWSDDLFLMLLRQVQIQRIDENPLTESCILRFRCMLNWLHYITVESRENFTVERYSRRQVFTSSQSQLGIESKAERICKQAVSPKWSTSSYKDLLPNASINI